MHALTTPMWMRPWPRPKVLPIPLRLSLLSLGLLPLSLLPLSLSLPLCRIPSP